MRTRDRLLNKSEEVVLRELEAIADDNGLRVFASTRLSDVLEKDTYLTPRKFSLYVQAHFDFVVTDANMRPLMAVEYDGLAHSLAQQQERDRIKDELCRQAGLGILRIGINHVTRTYRGMTILRWIVEVTEFEKQFYQAQQQGQIHWDEPFDPAMVAYDGRGRRWPYWLSADGIQEIHAYLRSLPAGTLKGMFTISGYDETEGRHSLCYARVGDKVICARVMVRHQNLEFPAYDLLHEIAICELVLNLERRGFRTGTQRGFSVDEFRAVHREFVQSYDDPQLFHGKPFVRL